MKAGIVGAGLMGRLLASQLLEQGWDITLFERDARGENSACGYTGAGMLSPYSEIETADTALVCELGFRGIELWPTMLDSLETPVFFQQKGSLITAHSRDKAELSRFQRLLMRRIPNNDSKMVQAGDIEQELAHLGEALFLPREGQVAGYEAMDALQTQLINHGVQWFDNCAADVSPTGQVITDNQSYNFDWVFDCRGLGAKPQWEELRGVRGELLWLYAPDVTIMCPVRLMHPRYRLYLVPRPGNIYLLGATEVESEDMSTISVRACLELLSALYSLQPAFAEARILKTLTNCRPALPDNLPAIIVDGQSIRINGLYRHGFLLAPALVEIITNYFNNREGVHGSVIIQERSNNDESAFQRQGN